ncbi:the GLUG motif protein family protein [Clostridium sp. CAG:780]|nr:the GLUG motif protein family protein [Clostridium sp. CAG:780]
MTTIENCYNIHNINASGAGGIIGYIIRIYETATSKININNCYNIGEIRGNVIGELVGKTYRINQEDFKVSNSYYIEKRNNAVGQGNATETNVESKSQQYMKTNEFVELLNSNIDSTNTDWKKWKLGTNGYPTFID